MSVVHRCPIGDAAVTPCCALSPLELPRSDRITSDAGSVTCWTGDDPRLTQEDR